MEFKCKICGRKIVSLKSIRRGAGALCERKLIEKLNKNQITLTEFLENSNRTEKMEISDAKEWKICPLCGRKYNEPPALSRKDNITKICSICGNKEVLMQFMIENEKDIPRLD